MEGSGSRSITNITNNDETRSTALVHVVRKKQPTWFPSFTFFDKRKNIEQEKDVILSSRIGFVYE